MAALLHAPLQPVGFAQVEKAQKSAAAAAPKAVASATPLDFITHKQVDPVTGQERIVRRFAIGRHLGKGAFGSCFEATDVETRQAYAAKIVAKASLTKKSAQAKVLSSARVRYC